MKRRMSTRGTGDDARARSSARCGLRAKRGDCAKSTHRCLRGSRSIARGLSESLGVRSGSRAKKRSAVTRSLPSVLLGRRIGIVTLDAASLRPQDELRARRAREAARERCLRMSRTAGGCEA
jgi:hypothetical protein